MTVFIANTGTAVAPVKCHRMTENKRKQEDRTGAAAASNTNLRHDDSWTAKLEK